MLEVFMGKLGLICILLAGACVKKDDDGTFSQAQAKAAGDSIGSSIETSAALFGPLDQTTSLDEGCVAVTGDPADPDMDNIPVNGTLTFACSAEGFGLVGMLTGTLAITDDQPAAQAWAFTGSANLRASLAGTGGNNSITIDRDGSIVATQASVVGPFSLAHDVDQVTVIRTGGGDGGGGLNPSTTNITEQASWTLTVVPMVSWTPGGLIVTGSLAATGDWNLTVDEASADATLATPTPLTLDPACATLVTAGVVTATYPVLGGGSETITVRWTGCGAHVVERG
jgi:hypothetical protein